MRHFLCLIAVAATLAGCSGAPTPLAAQRVAARAKAAAAAPALDPRLTAVGRRLLEACFDQLLDPQRQGAVSLDAAAASGLLALGQARALDRDQDGQLTRAEFAGLAADPAMHARLTTMVENLFAHATDYGRALTPAQAAAIEVSYGAKQVPGEAPKPLTFTFAIAPDAFQAADADGDGLLSRDEAFMPLAEGMVRAQVGSKQALDAAFDFLIKPVLPWAH